MINEIRPDFHLPTEIYIRLDILDNIADILSGYGSRIILVTTSSDFELFHDPVEKISNSLKESDIGCIIYDQLPEIPNTEDIDIAVSFTKKTKCDLIIGFGGVESLNAAKAISLLTNNYLFSYDLFSKPNISNPPINLITIPAHPVFGFEIIPMFYINEIHELKIRTYHNNNLYPLATIIDPVLSLSIDEDKTLKSAISTLAVSTESIISKVNNDIINTYALKAIDLIFRNLPVAYKETQNRNARVFLSTASVMSGIAFSISNLSATLAISLAVSSRTDLTVENAMSIILPHIMEFNLTSSPGKYVQMSKVMGENVKDITVIEAAIKAVEAIRRLEANIEIPQRLSQFEVSKSKFKDISNLAMTYPFIENSPRPLNTSEIETILIAAY